MAARDTGWPHLAREPRIFEPTLPAEHLDEIGYLLEARPGRVRSPLETLDDLLRADDRLAAHLHGLRIAGRRAAPLFEETLAGDDDALAAAAAWTWLQLDPDAARGPLAAALGGAAPERREALREALCHGPLGPLAADLRAVASAEDAGLAAAAAEALAANGESPPPLPLARWLASDDPATRRVAARLAGRLGAGALEPVARGDADPEVRHEALRAAAWNREPWVVAAWARGAPGAGAEDGVWAWAFAALAGPDERESVLALRTAPLTPAARLRALAASGDPEAIAVALAALASADADEAAAAIGAFEKLTGVEAVQPRPPLDPEADPDAAEPPAKPDVEKARAHWEANRERYEAGTRWCRGFDLARPESAAAFAELDLESRWEACVRARRRGAWNGDGSQLELRLGRDWPAPPADPARAADPPRGARAPRGGRTRR